MDSQPSARPADYGWTADRQVLLLLWAQLVYHWRTICSILMSDDRHVSTRRRVRVRRHSLPNPVLVGIYLSYSAAVVLFWLLTGRGSLVTIHLPTSVLALAVIATSAFSHRRLSLREIFGLNMVLLVVFLLAVPYVLFTLVSYQIGADILVADGHITEVGYATMRIEIVGGTVLLFINSALYLLLK
jgi:hypothetical protein